ncbi:recombinase family protein [Mariprofundus ferrooxydans]|uniref:recombinase family protein n=1 Tax=Mariprofundus ferrooxydans TaxID=314344 RepID=UPI00036D16DB|nr:recombinase family protein [Mariprofundus ferrooxydans]
MTKQAYSYIRFSSPEQQKGDSLRRQLEASRDYAKKHGLVLDESLRDIGVSAYRGKNRTVGALKRFIELVESGRVKKGSILILESLDRLTRQQVFTALSLFASILEAGVEIVTLADEQHYTQESVNSNVGQLMYSVMSMSRSHEESAMKARRSAASWENRRRRALESHVPATGQCPHWLTLSDDKQRFDVIDEYAVIVRRIFEQSTAGIGRRKIAEDLNSEGIKPFGHNAKKWHTSYIARVLSSRSVIGEYQPTKNGEPIGEIIKDYYPSIVSEHVFYRAQSAQQNRRTNKSAGRKGIKFSNLFTGMCKCLECGDTYRYMPRGNASLLMCDSNYMSSGCTCSKRWRYRDVENAALLILADEIDWFGALGGHTNSRQYLQDEISSLQAKLAAVEKTVDRLADLFIDAEAGALAHAKQRYLKASDEADDLRRQIEAKDAELRTYTPTQQHVDKLNSAIFELSSEVDDKKLYELRAQINASFREVGLRLYFNEAGVYYYVKSTGQKGIVLCEEGSEMLTMAAELEMIQRSLAGLDAYTDRILKAA